ncbi:hypothetical protein FACS18945_1550 [Bacteroidia bacterium]|nr:hypothetical protein FACS18945_1550 [Bacteroidia bacterium]
MGQTWGSDVCGDVSYGDYHHDVTATLNTSTGVLTIRNSGLFPRMADFSYAGNDNGTPPWYALRSSIRTVIMDEGIINIGNNAFKDCTKLTSVRIANSVTRIGVTSFMNCTSLTSLTIPACVETIEGGAFYGCRNLTVDCRMRNYPSIEYFPPTKPNFNPPYGTVNPFNGVSKVRVLPTCINDYSSGTYAKEILYDEILPTYGEKITSATEMSKSSDPYVRYCEDYRVYKVPAAQGVYTFYANANCGIGIDGGVYNSSGARLVSNWYLFGQLSCTQTVAEDIYMIARFNCPSITLTYTGKLSTPTLNSPTSSGCSISLSWNSIAGATSYKVYRSSSSNGSYIQVGSTITSTTTTDTPPSNGTYYYKVEAINSSTKSDLSSYQSVSYTCTSSPTGDSYEQNNTQATAYPLSVSFSNNSATKNTAGSNIHTSSDLDYYKITLPAGYNYTVTPTLSDRDNSSYEADVKFSYMQSNTGTWSSTYDTQSAGNFSIENGGTLYFKVEPYSSSSVMGTYLLNVNITRNEISGTNPLSPDPYEVNNTQATSYDFGNAGTRFAPGRAKAITTTALSSSANINTAGSNIHTSGDLDFYKITLPAGYNYTVTPTLSDKDNSSYEADVKFSYMQSNTGIWSSIYDTQPAGNFSVANGGTLYFKVEPYSSSNTGTYLLNVDIIRNEINGTSAVETTETDKLTIFPNPAKDKIYIKTEQLIEKVEIADIAGRTVGANNYSPSQNGVVNISALPAGVYLVKIFIDGQSVTKKIIKE